MFTLSERGLSLFTVLIMIGVLGVSLTVTRFFLYQQTNAQRESETRKEMKEIYEAIMGNPETGTFGYVGDMGTPPASLNDLVVNPGTSFAFTGTNGVKIGWNGPYINAGHDLESYKKDAWGNDYAIVSGYQIRSNGSDGIADTPDDIVFPSKPLNSFDGFLALKVPKGGVLCEESDISAIVHYSNNGLEDTLTAVFDPIKTEYSYYVSDAIPLHHGIHAVEVRDTIGKTVLANVAVFAESTNTQIVGTFPYEGINLHPQFTPYINPVDNRAVEVDIVNATGCTEGEGVSYNISQMDIAIAGSGGQQYLSEIYFNDILVFTANPTILVSSDLGNPTSISPLEATLKPGLSHNKLIFQDASASGIYQLTYHYTDTEEPMALKYSTISFRLE
ncbi:MAG: hypothetical protein HY354_07900 [Planctomycetes bacterium]|nr:hypothetical protein [Planctomycetota bacterium]